jgi:ribosomal protein L11 methylase PrmA
MMLTQSSIDRISVMVKPAFHDVIVANILAEVILRFTSQAYDLLKDGGHFITSGIR